MLDESDGCIGKTNVSRLPRATGPTPTYASMTSSEKRSTGTRSEGTMQVHVHTKFCFLCVLTFLFQCIHCHEEGHHGEHPHAHDAHGHVHSDLQISQAPYVGGAGTPPSPEASAASATTANMLAEEQHFYIQQLFKRYGKKGRLDFQGFQTLLVSLGLGKVKVVEAEHEELGHDHVAHLDMLDVQEGLHSHLPADDHLHHHHHGKGGHRHAHTEKATTKCGTQDGDASPTADSGPLQDHNHTHDHDSDSDPDHVHEVQDQHKHSAGHAKGHAHKHGHGLSQDKEHTHAAMPASREDVSQHQHHHHHHDGGGDDDDGHHHDPPRQTPPPADVSSGSPGPSPAAQAEPPAVQAEQRRPEAASPPESGPPTAAAESRTKRPRKPGRERGQRGRNKTTSSTPPREGGKQHHDHKQKHGHDHSHDREHNHEHNHDHSHDREHNHEHNHDHSPGSKRKREAPGGPLIPAPFTPSPPSHSGGVAHQHEQCLNLTQLLTYYGLNADSQISQAQFTYLCPALLYQIDSRVCIRHYHQLEADGALKEPVHSAWVWLWGFVSITIISLLSLLGVVLVPILNQSCFKFLLTFLVALAVGTLSGDALLHLLPHAQGQHTHGDQAEAKAPEEDWLKAFDGVWKGLTALAGIYLLFIIEHCIGMVKHHKDQGGTFCARKRRGEEAKIGRKLSDHKLNRRSDTEWLNLKHLDKGGDGSAAVSRDNGHNDGQLAELQTPESPTAKAPLAPAEPAPASPARENGHKGKKHGHGHGHGHSHGGNCHTDQEMKDAGIASIAWMVIMGDGMHNFSDGLAIGAAFSANITGGISTSVAVFCHELPHELGDFAVLLKAGMSVKQAIVYNLLSALMAYVGMAIGTAVGQYTHNVTSWIFAVTAGMFLYVALVDMLPEMLHGDSEDHKRCQMGHFLLQNLGLMTGFIIMLLIAIFEDKIVFDFGWL